LVGLVEGDHIGDGFMVRRGVWHGHWDSLLPLTPPLISVTTSGFDHRIGHFRPLRIIGTTPNSSALNGLGASTWDRSRWGGRRHDQGPTSQPQRAAPSSSHSSGSTTWILKLSKRAL
jgi:hypothetical protein